MGFGLFILVNLALFIRPGEIIPDLQEVPVYQFLILSCLVLSFDRVLQTLSTLREQPITACILGLWLAAVLSHLTRLDTYSARQIGEKFGKVVIYSLLLVSLVDSTARLRQFLAWILGAITVMTALAVLQYHGYVELPGLKTLMETRFDRETGESIAIPRMCGSGIFNDPNDLCLALTMGVVLGLYWLSDTQLGPVRLLCMPALILLGYAARLTQSRGGFLGMLLALLALCAARFGWRRTLLPSLALVPVALLAIGGRQTDFTLDAGDTGQSRIQLWSEGLGLFRQSPVLGIGTGNMLEEIRKVAHNSFVQAFAEMGFIGGTLFAGSFYLALYPLGSLSRLRREIEDQKLARLQPFLLALVVGYAGGLCSLSRNYIELTFFVLCVSQVYLGLARVRLNMPAWGPGLVRRLGLVGGLSLVMLYLLTRSAVVWS